MSLSALHQTVSGDEDEGRLRRDYRLPCAYLWAAAVPTCLHIPIQLNKACFLRLERKCAFPALAPSRQASPLLPRWAVNADKRYPQPCPPLRARRTGKPELLTITIAKIGKTYFSSKFFQLLFYSSSVFSIFAPSDSLQGHERIAIQQMVTIRLRV